MEGRGDGKAGDASAASLSTTFDRDFIEQHTSGFDALKEFVSDYSLQRVTEATGLGERQVMEFARAIHEGMGFPLA